MAVPEKETLQPGGQSTRNFCRVPIRANGNADGLSFFRRVKTGDIARLPKKATEDLPKRSLPPLEPSQTESFLAQVSYVRASTSKPQSQTLV